MANKKNIAVLVMGLLFSFNLYAETMTIPAFSGKLNNHSSLPSSVFEIEYHFSCGYKKFPGDFTAYCGSAQFTAKVSDNGTFSVPEIAFDVDIDEEDPQLYKTELSTSVFVSIPQTTQGYPFGFARDGVSGLFEFTQGKYDASLAKTFTVFQVNAQDVLVDLYSGYDPLKWLTNIGRDLSVDFSFDFTNGQAANEQFENDPRTGFFKRSSWMHNNWAQIPQQLLIVAGAWTKDAPVTMQISGPDLAATTTTFHYSSVFPDAARTLAIDDTVYKDPSGLRTLAGTWENSRISLSYSLQDEMDIINIQNYFSAEITCNKNKLTGSFIFRDAQNLPAKELLRVPVEGSCNGESGLLTFSLKKKSGEMLNLNLQITKVLAFLKVDHRMSVMVSSDIMEYELSTGSEVSSEMVLRDSLGVVQGTIYLSRSKKP